MKKHLVLLFLLFSIVSISQSSFCEGWKEGYKQGYCYGKYGCGAPVAPVCPVPNIGEDNYRGGYNAGFIQGRRNNTNSTNNSNAGGAYGQLKPIQNNDIGSLVQEHIRNNPPVKRQRTETNYPLFSRYLDAKSNAIRAFEEEDYNDCIAQYYNTKDFGFYDSDFEFVTGLSFGMYWKKTKDDFYFENAKKHLRLAIQYGHPEASKYLYDLIEAKNGE